MGLRHPQGLTTSASPLPTLVFPCSLSRKSSAPGARSLDRLPCQGNHTRSGPGGGASHRPMRAAPSCTQRQRCSAAAVGEQPTTDAQRPMWTPVVLPPRRRPEAGGGATRSHPNARSLASALLLVLFWMARRRFDEQLTRRSHVAQRSHAAPAPLVRGWRPSGARAAREARERHVSRM